MPAPRRLCHALAALLLLLALLISPAQGPSPAAAAGSCETAAPLPGESRLSPERRALLAVARSLPLDLKVGQLLMPGFVGTAPDHGLLDRARRGHVGGFFLLQRNVHDADQLRDLLAQLGEAAAEGSAGIRPFLATDFEGGTVNTLRAITGTTPSAWSLAARGLAGVQARGAQDAETLKSLGFTTSLAPVADVLTVEGGAIGSRAFSSDAGAAAALSRAYLRGLQGAGVLGVLKHFPGHGGTSDDSHLLLPVVERSLAELDAIDLVPYRQAFAAGEAQAVMVGHLLLPVFDPDLPSSLSRAVVGGLLRDRLAFDGLVMTDELKMAAISSEFSVGAAAVLALQAGVDVILADYTGAEQDEVERTLMRACTAGELPAGRLEQSVARVLRLKLAYGLAGEELGQRYALALGALTGAPAETPAATAPPAAPAVTLPDLEGVEIAGLPDGAAGRFYAEAAGGGEVGFALTDEGDAQLLAGYAALGGPPALGYPISQRFERDGQLQQLTQGALLRWDPERSQVVPANTFELFDSSPATTAWLAERGIPAAAEEDDSAGDLRRAVATRLSWLTNESLRAAFLSAGGERSEPWPDDEALAAGLADTPDDQEPWGAIERFGLPMSRPERFGPFVAQRFQRATLQLWLDEVPGMPPPGTVTRVLAGEVLRDAGKVPAEALIPTTIDDIPAITAAP